ncbi:MAG: hypothetical protein SFV55_03165 [Haliscomenobacter sp.]|uniref:hypothetical protein n=1 Tax=Haliscomenobacter sp. TaxID=2717303 RepID=UPI0029A8E6D1|nr:hypothetical protein [Haliscomenobacter sp.]MDX2067397.1 hypothetical protein [Haliscomenobacter sp.]
MKSLLCTLIVGLFLALGTANAQAPTTSVPATTALDSLGAKELLGKYDTGGMGTIIVSWEQGKVIGTLEGQGSAELKPTNTPDVLSIVGYEGTATFIRDEQKKVIKVRMEVKGQVIEAAKL